MTAVSLEEPVTADLTNHFPGILVGQGGHAEFHITQNLDVHAAQTEGDKRSEERIIRHADHQFYVPGNHRLHQHTIHWEGT